MKKTGIAVFCVLSLFGLSLVGVATAYNAAFTHTLYAADSPPTVDGTYSVADQWIASGTQTFGTNGVFRDMWTMTPNLACLLIETADNTNDAGDYWVVCYDSTAAGGATEPNGGAAPQTDDYKLVVTGHGASATVQWFRGTGTAWSTTPATGVASGLLTQAQSLSVTPMRNSAHYVLELYIDKSDTSLGTVAMGYTWGQYVAYFDAHAGGNGLQQWPPAPASVDVPNGWGYIPYDMAANPAPNMPEYTSIIAMLTLSSAGLVGVMLLRKRQKIANL